MKRLPLFLLSTGFVSLAINFFVPPSQAQTTKDEQVNKTVEFTTEGKEPVEFNVNGTIDRVNPAAVVGAISLGGGVELDGAQTGINFALAGADPESVSNLMLALAGMISGGNEVDPNRYALAINAFNTIVDKANLNTLTALKEIPEFTDIRTLLADLRNNKAN